MAFIQKEDLKELNEASKSEALIWREDYPEYERLAENGLLETLDANLPEVNDGSLCAALFKLPKRIVSSKLSGTVKAIDRDEAWMSELANLRWRNEIIPNAKSQASFTRKWKVAVYKAAAYGSVPIITLPVERDGKTYTDFIIAHPQDVRLEAGKVSDADSDILFWDVYYTKHQFKNLIEQAKDELKEAKDNKTEAYNKWLIKEMEDILKGNAEESRSGQDTPYQENGKNVQPKGFKFVIAVQRGINAPFYMYHEATNKCIREWTNPDPTGDINIHYLFCYQNFINPYGIGIVKLAGGTQNVLDYMRQQDVRATALGLDPTTDVGGDTSETDFDSIVNEPGALRMIGNATVQRNDLANGVYNLLPDRMAMYKTSLSQLIPVGDTSIASGSGDPNYSKTPAGVKFQEQSLSIDDEDFKDNLYGTYEQVAKSMINTEFANMEGTDLMKVSDDERELLINAGLEFPENEDGEVSNQVEVVWDDIRAKFNFEVDAEIDKAADDAAKLEGLTNVATLISNPDTQALITAGKPIILGKKQLDPGELFSEIISLTTDNDKIITDVSSEEETMVGDPMQEGMEQSQEPVEPPKTPADTLTYKDAPEDIKRQIEMQAGYEPSQLTSPVQQQLDQKTQADQTNALLQATKNTESQQPEGVEAPEQEQPVEEGSEQLTDEQIQANVQEVMTTYGVDEDTALAALEAEHNGTPIEDIVAELQRIGQQGGEQ